MTSWSCPLGTNRLAVIGFVGRRQGSDGVYYATSLDTQIHRRSQILVGIAEQRDLLQRGATPVLAGIPLLDRLLSRQQARVLAVHASFEKALLLIENVVRAADQLAELTECSIESAR
ncbi:hypothetical protein [Kribbella antibiotica]|uniref:hypothetical protein n=1 Tax=Kribbella antibiotica TaxID=190195 RepID=UPI001EDEA901|nr:hypothetical protein [Kribbella antibiotica]